MWPRALLRGQNVLVELVPLPMQAPDRSYPPFDSPEYLFEIKFDGYRRLARVEEGQARLFTKSRA